jgi:hypothetical protein
MIAIFLLVLTAAQQAKHDAIERAAYERLQEQTRSIFEIDHPGKQMVADYNKAGRCYVKLHLYRVQDCDKELDKVDRDLKLSPKSD